MIIALKRQHLSKLGDDGDIWYGIVEKKYKYTLNMKTNKKNEPYTWKKKAS